MSASDAKRIKFLTYNVWSNQHVAVYRRMQSVSDLIASHAPDVIFLQKIFRGSPWWGLYVQVAVPDSDAVLVVVLPTTMEHQYPLPPAAPAGLFSAFLDWKRSATNPYGADGRPRLHPVFCDHRLHVAMCRLPEPTRSDIRSVARLDKAHDYLRHFASCSSHNAVLAGDMNWDEDLDGPFPIAAGSGWVDAWRELRGDDGAGGWTYDSVANPMLRGFKPGGRRMRPDRFLCKLRDFSLDSTEMVGTEAIPGVTYYDEKGGVLLPVLPSHRIGLLLTISPKQA
ncbi:hypothetical protein VPH35_131908 [Triticum aestivum]